MSGYKIKRLGTRPRPRASTAHSYFSFGSPSVTPVPLPPLPRWMLDTPMHSKVPMVPAPKGKIVLHTTGLCEKLHHTLSDLDFDPNPQGLSTEYSSLHDKHLKSHYSHPSMVSRLVRNGFITPEGKVVCTLKEFNDYQQHLKRVRLEKETQDRKRKTHDERTEKEQLRWSRPKTAKQIQREKRADDTKERKEKLVKEQRVTLVQRLQERDMKRVQQLEERRRAQKAEEVIKEKEQERVRFHKMQLAKEDKRKKSCYLRRRSEAERNREIKLEMRRQMSKEARQNKLEQSWERKLLFQELREIEDKLKKHHAEEIMDANIEVREMTASAQRLKQQATFHRIRENRAQKASDKEQNITRHLEAKHKIIREKFDRKRKRIAAKYKKTGTSGSSPHRYGSTRYRHIMRSSWELTQCLMADISGHLAEEEQTTETTPLTDSPQDLPAVSPPGVCRKLSWHESMSDLATKEKLPPIGSTIFNEADEEMYAPSSPEPTTSEESHDLVESQLSTGSLGSLSGSTTDVSVEEDDAIHQPDAPAIEIDLEEDQCPSLEFTQDDFEHFMEMGSGNSLETFQHVDPNNIHEQTESKLDQDTSPEEPLQAQDDKATKPVDFTTSVVTTVILKAISSLFQCAGSSDTISLTSESCHSRQDTIGTPNRDAESDGNLVGRTPDDADSVLTGVIEDDSNTSFGVPAEEQGITEQDISRLSTRSCLIVRDAIHNAMSSLDNSRCDSMLVTESSSMAVEFGSPVSTGEEESTIGENDVEETVSQELSNNAPAGQSEMAVTAGVQLSTEEDEVRVISQLRAGVDGISEGGMNIDNDDNVEESDTSADSDQVGYSLQSRSSLLQSVIDVFGDDSPPTILGELRSSSEEYIEEDEDDDGEEEEGEVIGFLENSNMAGETETSLVAECKGDPNEDMLTGMASISDESRAVVEGAIRRASSGDFFGHKGSITEAVLSIENVTRSVSSKRLIREKVSGKYSSDGDNHDLKKASFEPEDHYHQIIPLYHNHAVDVGEDLINSNLSAISMKSDSHKTPKRAHQTGSRNSFRNIFRPDLTYCEGSAKCLKSTLIRQLSQSSASSSGSSHAHMMHLLDQEHHDVTAHHSDEEIVHTDDAEGVCQLPRRRAFKVHHVVDDIVPEQEEPSENNNDVTDQARGDKIEKAEDPLDNSDGIEVTTDSVEEVRVEEEKRKPPNIPSDNVDDSSTFGVEINSAAEVDSAPEQVDAKLQPVIGKEISTKTLKDTKEQTSGKNESIPNSTDDNILTKGNANLSSNESDNERSQQVHLPSSYVEDTGPFCEAIPDVLPRNTQENSDGMQKDVPDQATNTNTNRRKLSCVSVNSNLSSGTDVLIKVSQTRSSFVSTPQQQLTSIGISGKDAGETILNSVDSYLLSGEDIVCKHEPTLKDRENSCKSYRKARVKHAESSTTNKSLQNHSKNKDHQLANPQFQITRACIDENSKTGVKPESTSKVPSTTTLPSMTKDGVCKVKPKHKKTKAQATRTLSTSRSMMNGNHRPSTAKLRHLSQSKSANAPSQAKFESFGQVSRRQENNDVFASSQDNNRLGCESVSRFHVKKTHRNSAMEKDGGRSSSTLACVQEHSVIFVQPVKEKRSSCTVIMPVNKKSSAKNCRSSERDL